MYFLEVEKLKAYAKNFQKVWFWGEKINFLWFRSVLKIIEVFVNMKQKTCWFIRDKMGDFAHLRY